jgi:hypothetical protein
MAFASSDIDETVFSFRGVEAIENLFFDRVPVGPAKSNGCAEKALHEDVEVFHYAWRTDQLTKRLH